VIYKRSLVKKPAAKTLVALKALAEPRRLEILSLLKAGPRSVGEIANEVDVSQQAVSQHLAVLEDAGLVHTRRQGRYKFHHLDTAPLLRIAERWRPKHQGREQ
jgi:DNA-binding transcriptional ArsR family regulator